MKFCSKCGSEIGENVKFCSKCGADQAVKQQTANATVTKSTATKTNSTGFSNSLIKIVAIVVAILLVIILFKSCVGSKSGTVDIEKCYQYTITGVDSKGDIEVEIDKELLRKSLIKANRELKKEENLDDLEDLVKYTNVYVKSDSYDLSNGDTVVIGVSYLEHKLEKYDLKLKKDCWKLKIKGLHEKTTADVKDCYSVTVTGMNSEGKAEINIDTDKMREILVKANSDLGKIEKEDDLDKMMSVSVKADKTKNLSNGDKIVLTLKPNDVWEDYGIEPSPMEWTIEVSGLLDSEE